MIKGINNQPLSHSVAAVDPYQDCRAVLHALPAIDRIAEINIALKKVAKNPTSSATFHRKKLLRMHDAARLEAGLVTPAQLQQENSPSQSLDFSKAKIVWKSRVSAGS
mgnify:CR=1 FL=1